MTHEVLDEPMEELEEIDQEVALRENSAFLIFVRVDVFQRYEWLFMVLLKRNEVVESRIPVICYHEQ